MLVGLTIIVTNSWLGYRSSKAKTYAMEALYKNDQLFHSRLKVLENTTAVGNKNQ